jgi:hypothetical protein
MKEIMAKQCKQEALEGKGEMILHPRDWFVKEAESANRLALPRRVGGRKCSKKQTEDCAGAHFLSQLCLTVPPPPAMTWRVLQCSIPNNNITSSPYALQDRTGGSL